MMKQVYTIFFLLLAFGWASAQVDVSQDPLTADAAEKGGKPEIRFDSDTHEWGKIEEGDTVYHDFAFTNVGSAPLILERVKPSCNCTHVKFTETAVEPGQQGVIHVAFDTYDKDRGPTTRNVLVFYNGETKPLRLTIKGEIIEPSVEGPDPGDGSNQLNLGGDKKSSSGFGDW